MQDREKKTREAVGKEEHLEGPGVYVGHVSAELGDPSVVAVRYCARSVERR
jgi:hypothetical protein